MKVERTTTELHDLIHQKLTAIIREMEAADWGEEEVVHGIERAIAAEWLPRLQALQEARDAQPENFISDGNEG